MPQDARNKLRQMGGITAAFPEMVQTFQEGGMSQAPAARRAPVEGFTFQDWQSMSRGDRREAGLPVSDIGGQLFFDRFQTGLGLVPPDARYTSEGLIEAAPPPAFTSDPAIISSEMSVQEAQRAQDDIMSRGLPENPLQRRAALQALEEAKDAERQASRTLREARISGEDGGDARPTSRGPMMPTGGPGTFPVSSLPVDPETLLRRTLELSQPDPVEDPGDGGDGDGDTPAEPSLRGRYDEQLSLMMEVLGEDDKDAARDKSLTLAMVGLAALAGPKGQTLRNMAEGAIVGLGMAGKRREARREREQEFKTLAMQGALGELDADRRERLQKEMFDLEAGLRRELQASELAAESLGDTGVSAPTGSAVLNYLSGLTKTLLETAEAETFEEASRMAREQLARQFPELEVPEIETPTAPGLPDDLTPEELDLLSGG